MWRRLCRRHADRDARIRGKSHERALDRSAAAARCLLVRVVMITRWFAAALAAPFLLSTSCSGDDGASRRSDGPTFVPAPSEPTAIFVATALGDAEAPSLTDQDRAHVYFATRAGAVHRVAKDGSGAARLGAVPGTPVLLAIGSRVVVVSDGVDGRFTSRLPKAGGQAEVIGPAEVVDLASDGVDVFWIEGPAGSRRVMRLRDDAGAPEPVAEVTDAEVLEAAGGYLYHASSAGEPLRTVVRRIPAGGGEASPSGEFPGRLLAPHLLRVLDGVVHVVTSDYAVYRLDEDGPRRLVDSAWRAAALDTAGLYLAGSSLARQPFDERDEVPVAPIAGQAIAVLVDGNSVTWFEDRMTCLAWDGGGKHATCLGYEHDVSIVRAAK